MPDPTYDTSRPDFDLAAVLAEAGAAPRPGLDVLDQVCRVAPLVPDPPAPTDIRRDNPRKQGEIGFSDAVGWFGRRALTVSIPLVDAQAYDLIVDLDGSLAKVQVKTSTSYSPYGVPVASIETAGGNQSFHTRKPFDNTATELLYVLADGQRWVIPTSRVRGTRSISLGHVYEDFRVPADDT